MKVEQKYIRVYSRFVTENINWAGRNFMKNKYIHIRVSEAEHEALRRLAATNGLTPSAFMRMLIARELNKLEK